MFKLENVYKRYMSKSGEACDALVDVNLTLPDKGLVFIVGTSGSGKSTLLNLLGGLDILSYGKISYNGETLFSIDEDDLTGNTEDRKEYTDASAKRIIERKGKMIVTFEDKMLARYRNNMVGFVFQDYHLLEKINVEDNITIPLHLQRRKDKEEFIAAALHNVGLDGYQKRRINELSGGQKQRVAIARAIVKSPKVLLADEPTGNLDSETGEEIMLLLKQLSESSLVVVVTHDAAAAKRHGDYMVGLSDGRVVYNTCPDLEFLPEPKPDPKVSEKSQDLAPYIAPFRETKASMPLLTSFKMGAENLKKSPFRTFFAILAAVAMLFGICFMQLEFLYSEADGNARIMNQLNINVFTVEKTDEYSGYNLLLPSSFFSFLSAKYPKAEYIRQTKEGYFLVRNEQDILDFGFEFVGEHIAFDENSVYITEGYYYYMASTFPNTPPINEIVGTRVGYIRYFHGPFPPVVAGIVKTNKLINPKNEYEKTHYFYAGYTENYFLFDDAQDSVDKIIVNKNSIKNLKKFLDDVFAQGLSVNSVYSDEARTNRPENYYTEYLPQVAVIVFLLIVFLGILVANTISYGIWHRTREIGILKALGAPDRTISAIYYSESFIFSLITFILGIAVTFVSIAFWNYNRSIWLDITVPVMAVNFGTVLSIFLISFIPVFIAAVIPLRKIKRMAPINAVKSTR